ncbi:MAG: hypothetical protein CMJ78_12145 [Planctomycetaceae bacterium]|nr:hypothetical protein [Planctomycetaceae bacterium]
MFRVVFSFILCTSSVFAAEPARFSDRDLDFFEKKIRPVLIKHCYKCHSQSSFDAGKLKGGFRVDFRSALLKGGDSGASIVPGKAAESLLIEALKYESLEMPPSGKLPDSVIADFEKWINAGAADPRTGDVTKPADGIDIEQGRKHWAYQPLGGSQDATIDSLVEELLQQAGLKMSEPADKTTLVRRLYFDLIGLPPTAEQIDAFVKDDSLDAVEKLVDELLANKAYGERWGRHWLDVVRYADSITLRGFVLPEAWRYRDYVISTFNEDRPFADFIVEQIAGDLIRAESLAERRRNQIATGFLALGNTNLEDQDKANLRMDVVDEQLDTIGRAFLALTIGCARCHDHKFDPIPTRDYYAMAGILRSTKTLNHSNVSKWIEMPLPAEPELQGRLDQYKSDVQKLEAKINGLKGKLNADAPKSKRTSIAVSEFRGVVVDNEAAEVTGPWQKSTFSKPYVAKGYLHDSGQPKGACRIVFRPELRKEGEYEVRMAYSGSRGRCSKVPVVVNSIDAEKTVFVDEQKRPTIDGVWYSLGRFRFDKDNTGTVSISNKGTTGIVTIDAIQFLLVGEANEPPKVEKIKSKDMLSAKEKKALTADLKALTKELGELRKKRPAEAKFLTIQEESEIEDTQVHIRGNVHNLGDTVPRGFLQVASTSAKFDLPKQQSGRREFGQWIARVDNPLTARVIVNRVWHWMFGSGLVRTTDNFGTAGEVPSHPELLDTLAQRFIAKNWSVKQLVREIALSRAYQQSSVSNVLGEKTDPDNRLLWRMNRRRLDAECVLDSMLLISGQLDHTTGGSIIRKGTGNDYNYQHESNRRGVYWPVFRNSIPDIFDAFDFANPSFTTGKRNASSVAPQALFMMNNPFVFKQASATVDRLFETKMSDEQRMRHAFRVVLGRSPHRPEIEAAMKFVQSGNGDDRQRWTQVVQSLMASLDFRFVY